MFDKRLTFLNLHFLYEANYIRGKKNCLTDEILGHLRVSFSETEVDFATLPFYHTFSIFTLKSVKRVTYIFI